MNQDQYDKLEEASVSTEISRLKAELAAMRGYVEAIDRQRKEEGDRADLLDRIRELTADRDLALKQRDQAIMQADGLTAERDMFQHRCAGLVKINDALAEKLRALQAPRPRRRS
jgi:hypothetical protein